MEIKIDEPFAAVQWHNGKLRLLDQRKLPGELVYRDFDSCAEVATAIKQMIVRGAPAIGIAAAYAVVLAARAAYRKSAADWQSLIETALENLDAARPTAVNLRWAITGMRKAFAAIDGDPEPLLLEFARKIHAEDIAANHVMGRLGADLIASNSTVVTHCNAGALATGGYGTALGVIRTANKRNLLTRVYVSETRPWLQGARLTGWELQQADIPVELVIDSAVSGLMKDEAIGWLIVGADRIAANGDVANKIGTYSHAVAANYHAVKVMVVAPSSTVDMQIASGQSIPVERRKAAEITDINGKKIAPQGIAAVNPAFDITPAELVDFIVTENGVIARPNAEKMLAFFGKI